jgi:hypothetical protein
VRSGRDLARGKARGSDVKPFRPVTTLDLGIFLVSLAVLLTELLLTRIFSVTMFYHLSFMVVSLAMLGFGGSGLLVALKPRWFPEAKLFSQAALGAILFAAASVLAIKMSFRLPITLESSAENWRRIALVYLAAAAPFFFGGLVVSLILTHRSAHAHRLYFFDLSGAALGCVALIPTTDWLGAPSSILAAAAIGALAGGLLAWGRDRRIVSIAFALSGFLLLGIFVNARVHFFDIRFAKGARQQPTLAMRWNAFSRVDVVGTPKSLWTAHAPVFAGFSGRLDPDFTIPEVKLLYDADATTQITYFDGDLRRLEYLGFDVSSSAYHLRKYHNVLVIGPGGGRDILTALSLGSGPVTGVEINPITIDLMRTRFRTFSGGLYDGFPGVTVVHDEGRSFLRRGTARYDIIEASLVDTWAASAAGAYALTENGLYTVEAFEDYLAHLTPDGVICFNRWFTDPPAEALRVVSLAREALLRRGVRNPLEHVMVVRTDPTDTSMPAPIPLGSILVKLSPFSPQEIEALTRYAADMGFVLVYAPNQRFSPASSLTPEQRDFRAVLGPGAAEFVESYPFDVSPVFDDRPFFFDRAPIVPWIAARLGLSESPVGRAPLGIGSQTLLTSLVTTALATALLLFLPYWSRRRGGDGESPGGGTLPASGAGSSRIVLWAMYFLSLGLGFILVEMVLIQRFSLFLGYPVYSLSVVLFTLLLTSAVGSLSFSGLRSPAAALVAVGLLALLLAVYLVGLPPLLSATRGLSTFARIAIAIATIAPLGLLMGIPFPSGIRRAGGESKPLVAWAWAVNGGASVFASALAVLISMTFGFTATLAAGAGAYGLAFAALGGLSRGKIMSQAIAAEPHS